MQIIDAQSNKLSEEHLEQIITTLDKGGVIIFPTETVYGLMCRYGHDEAKQKIFNIKKRSTSKQLQCLIPSRNSINQFDIKISPLAKKIITHFFPGAITVILENRQGKTFGFRNPDYPPLKNLLKKLNYPLWATSANISGQKDNLSFQKILVSLPPIIDLAVKGNDFLAPASTVVKVINNNFEILREGEITFAQINKIKKQFDDDK